VVEQNKEKVFTKNFKNILRVDYTPTTGAIAITTGVVAQLQENM